MAFICEHHKTLRHKFMNLNGALDSVNFRSTSLLPSMLDVDYLPTACTETNSLLFIHHRRELLYNRID